MRCRAACCLGPHEGGKTEGSRPGAQHFAAATVLQARHRVLAILQATCRQAAGCSSHVTQPQPRALRRLLLAHPSPSQDEQRTLF